MGTGVYGYGGMVGGVLCGMGTEVGGCVWYQFAVACGSAGCNPLLALGASKRRLAGGLQKGVGRGRQNAQERENPLLYKEISTYR